MQEKMSTVSLEEVGELIRRGSMDHIVKAFDELQTGMALRFELPDKNATRTRYNSLYQKFGKCRPKMFALKMRGNVLFLVRKEA